MTLDNNQRAESPSPSREGDETQEGAHDLPHEEQRMREDEGEQREERETTMESPGGLSARTHSM
jgi:hypothetical protein